MLQSWQPDQSYDFNSLAEMIFLIIVLYNIKNLKLSPLILSQYSIPEKNGG